MTVSRRSPHSGWVVSVDLLAFMIPQCAGDLQGTHGWEYSLSHMATSVSCTMRVLSPTFLW